MISLIMSIFLSLPTSQSPAPAPLPRYLWGECFSLCEKNIVREHIDKYGTEWILVRPHTGLFRRRLKSDALSYELVYVTKQPTWIQRCRAGVCK